MNIIAISNHIGAASSSVEKAFVMQVDTTIAGDLPDNQFLLRTHGNDVYQGNNFNVKTSDGQEFNNITAPTLTITFPSPGVYTLKISGKFSGTRYDYVTEGNKIIDILNWGDWEELQWARAGQSFRDCRSLTTFSAKDAPYLGGLDSQGIANMFYNCNNLNADFSKWDVSPVSNFGGLFARCSNFNNDSICNWNMSSATGFYGMFEYASVFNQDLSAWNTSNVSDMRVMFFFASQFNGNVSTWDTSSLSGSLYRTFSRSAFNGDLSGWDVSNITSLDNVFAYSPFNNNSISNWGVSNVSIFRGTFVGTSFNQDLSNWDTGMALSMDSMFSSSGFDSASIGNWNVSSVTTMQGMFYNSVFNKDISSWDVSSVTTMQGMFQDRGTKTNSAVNISGWTTSSLASTYQMFRGFGSNVQDLSNWDMSNVTDARGMFEFGGMTFDLSRWDIQGAVNLQGLLNQASNTSGVVGLWKFHNWNISQAVSITSMLGTNVITTASYDAMLVAWAAQVPTTALNLNVNSTQYTLGGEAEAARTSLINTYGWTITDGGGVAFAPFVFDATPFGGGRTVSVLTQAGYTYDYNVSVSTGESFVNQTGDLSINFLDSATRTFTITGLFPGFKCGGNASARYQVITWGSQLWRTLAESFEHPNFTLISIGSDVPNLNLCTSMFQTFNGVINFPAVNNLADWYTGNVTTMHSCFANGGGGGLNNVNLSSWDTSNVTDMRFMFSSNSSNWNLTSTDISQWNTKKVTTFQQMFYNAPSFNQPIQNWDVRSATGNAFQSFLNNATTNLGQFNQPLGLWNVNPSNYGSNFFRAMFYGQNAFDQDLSAWTITGLPNVSGNFNEFITNADLVARPMSFSTANYDKLLISWANQGFVYAEIISFGDAQYTTGGAAEAARNTLINTYGWTITDGGGVPILNNLVSYFKMDDDMIDTIDGQAPTINVGSTYEAGVVLDARSFNGAEYAIYSGNEKYNMSDGTSDIPFSVSFWLKIDDATNYQARILNVAQSNQGWQYRIMCWGTDISLNLFSQSDLSASHYKTVTLTAGSYGGYHHYVFTYDGSLSQGMKAYRDGTLISSSAIVSVAYTGMRDITPDYCFGRRTNLSAGYLKGSLDEFGVFKNQVLDSSNVQELYNKGLNGVPLNEVYVPLTTNLVASYNFDADFADYTGNNPLTPSGSTPPVAGVAGGVVSDCAEFNSTGDYTLAADSDDFSFTDGVTDLPFSVSFWANFTGYNSGASGGAWLLSKRDTSTNEEYQILFYQNQFQVTLFSGGGNANKLNAGLAYPPPIGSWHHYTVTYDGNATFTGIKLYIDGVSQTLTDSSAGTYIGMANGSQAVNIGSTSWSPSQGSFDGKLDEYHIWKNRELTEAEVTDIYTTELAGNSILP